MLTAKKNRIYVRRRRFVLEIGEFLFDYKRPALSAVGDLRRFIEIVLRREIIENPVV